MTQRGKNDIPPPMPHEQDLKAAYEVGNQWSGLNRPWNFSDSCEKTHRY